MEMYLFTNGDTAFLNANGRSIITARVPPASSKNPSNVKLIMPHMEFTAPSRPTAQQRLPTRAVSVQAVARTRDVYPDLCRIDISYTIFPNIALSIPQITAIVTPNGNFACNTPGSTLDSVNGIGTCRFSGS
jgi:hypothetical protein